MNDYHEPKWLEWAKKLQGMAQSGLAYSKNKYDIDRYEQLRDLAVEIMNEYTEAGEEKIRDLFCERGYQTPKVDVRGAVIVEDKILLVHEEIDGKWAMPGGWADIYYSPKENIEKECREEAGMEVEPYKLVGIFDWAKDTDAKFPWALYKIVMLARPLDLEHWDFEKNIETSEARFFRRDELPELSRGRTTKELIDLCFDMRDHPDRMPVVE